MSDHWRHGVVERAVLEAFDQVDARPDRPHRKSANVVHRMAEQFGISPRFGYDALCRLSQPWMLHIPLLDFHGNVGSPDDPPAPPRMTEARLSHAGMRVLAAERGIGPLVPVALINGDLHVDGMSPPYSPRRVIATLLAVADDPRLSDEEIIERVGPPASPTGCGVACDYVALGEGESTPMVLTAHLTYEHFEGGQLIVLTHLPLGIGADMAVQALAARIEAMGSGDPDWEPDQFDEDSGTWSGSISDALPLADVRNESDGYGIRIVCEPLKHTIPSHCEAQVASTWGVRTRREAQLPAPLPDLIRELVDTNPTAQRVALTGL
jgi:DNA gyrase/topoisomerase IV subunit A